MNYTKLPKKALLLLATPVLFSLTVPVAKLYAQSQTETKIRLMAEGLRARDSGDLATAKTNFEQLLVLAPNDVTVQRLLAGVNDAISKTASAPAAEVSVPASESVAAATVPNVEAPAPAASASDSAALPEVTYKPGQTAQAAPAKAADLAYPAVELAKEEEARVKELISRAKSEAKAAKSQASDGDFDAASARVDAAIKTLPVNTLTEGTIESLTKTKNDILLSKSQKLLASGDTAGAKAALDAYIAATSPENKAARKQASRIDKVELNPSAQPIEKLNPEFISEQKQIAGLLAKGRAQYAAGDIDGAQETYRIVETYSAENGEAKYFLKRIADEKAQLGALNREKTRSTMLQEVANAWQRPGVFIERSTETKPGVGEGSVTLTRKLNEIEIPSVSFSGVELSKVIQTLSVYSEEFDKSNDAVKGVNIVLGNQLAGTTVPPVNMTLRNMKLRRLLDIITEQTGYQYEVQNDLVLVKPSGVSSNLITEEFPLSKAALTRMTGVGGGSAAPAASADPFAPAPAAGGGGGGDNTEAIKRFLTNAGVPFDLQGSNLAYDGARIIVTHTNRNIERIRNIIGRYNDVRQVEIEAKFMDIEEGVLDELGIQWGVGTNHRGGRISFGSTNPGDLSGNTTIRNLNNASSNGITNGNAGSIFIGTNAPVSVPNSPASIPGSVDTGATAGALATLTNARFGNFDVSATLRALSQKSGSELLSAPKVTVLSGNRATITVGQELRYPQSYGDTQSTVSAGNTGGAAISITAGTPQDFTTRNIGVELGVTPTVEEDEYSISLELNPKVTEFEGFVEYGGQSAALTSAGSVFSSNIVLVPSGFYQPIFATREINTRVTVWDGATLVMGGLTREEVRRVDDKVPVLGDIPFVGRAFKSKGEASNKRNLIIFVTANLVSPGGSLKKQSLKGVAPSSTFQNPTYVTPSNPEARIRTNQ